MRHVWAADVQKKGAAKSAQDALTLLHTESREFVLHLDTDIIAQEEFPPVNVPGSGGLCLEEVRAALREALRQKTLLGLDVAQYNPDRDPDGSGAQKLVELLVDALSARLATAAPEKPAAEPVSAPTAESTTTSAVATSAETTREESALADSPSANSNSEDSN
jgi:hypothetical protein